MRVLGFGWPRTGTTSLRRALEILGFGPCHHMVVLSSEPGRAALWDAVARGEPDALQTALAGFDSAVDNPVCSVWWEAAQAFPDARILLTVREPAAWYRSYVEAIHLQTFGPDASLPPAFDDLVDVLRTLWLERTLGCDPLDEAACIASFERHEREVVDALGDRVLRFEASDGWEPLCAHLGVPVPDVPYPHKNSRAFIATAGHHET